MTLDSNQRRSSALCLAWLALSCSSTATEVLSANASGGAAGLVGSGGALPGGAPAIAGSSPSVGGADGVAGAVTAAGGTQGSSDGGSSGNMAQAGSLAVAGAAGAPSAAGAPGAAGGTSPSATCPAGALLCDDFESYGADTAPNGKWKVTNVGSPTTVVDTAHAFSGTKAAHIHGMADNNRQYTFMTAGQAPLFPVTSSKLFVRFMLYITKWPSATATHTRLAWLGTSQALSTPQRGFDGAGYVLCNYNGIAIERLSSGYFRNTSANLRDSSRVGKWACLEMEVDNTGGPPPGGVGAALPHIFESDKEYTLALAGDNSVAYNGIKFEALQFSLWSPQTDTVTSDYWIDDVIMSTQHIGCPK